MSATPIQVRDQFLKTLLVMTGSESLRDECAEIYQLGRGGLPPSYALPLFNNLENKHNLEVVGGR